MDDVTITTNDTITAASTSNSRGKEVTTRPFDVNYLVENYLGSDDSEDEITSTGYDEEELFIELSPKEEETAESQEKQIIREHRRQSSSFISELISSPSTEKPPISDFSDGSWTDLSQYPADILEKLAYYIPSYSSESDQSSGSDAPQFKYDLSKYIERMDRLRNGGELNETPELLEGDESTWISKEIKYEDLDPDEMVQKLLEEQKEGYELEQKKRKKLRSRRDRNERKKLNNVTSDRKYESNTSDDSDEELITCCDDKKGAPSGIDLSPVKSENQKYFSSMDPETAENMAFDEEQKRHERSQSRSTSGSLDSSCKKKETTASNKEYEEETEYLKGKKHQEQDDEEDNEESDMDERQLWLKFLRHKLKNVRRFKQEVEPVKSNARAQLQKLRANSRINDEMATNVTGISDEEEENEGNDFLTLDEIGELGNLLTPTFINIPSWNELEEAVNEIEQFRPPQCVSTMNVGPSLEELERKLLSLMGKTNIPHRIVYIFEYDLKKGTSEDMAIQHELYVMKLNFKNRNKDPIVGCLLIFEDINTGIVAFESGEVPLLFYFMNMKSSSIEKYLKNGKILYVHSDLFDFYFSRWAHIKVTPGLSNKTPHKCSTQTAENHILELTDDLHNVFLFIEKAMKENEMKENPCEFVLSNEAVKSLPSNILVKFASQCPTLRPLSEFIDEIFCIPDTYDSSDDDWILPGEVPFNILNPKPHEIDDICLFSDQKEQNILKPGTGESTKKETGDDDLLSEVLIPEFDLDEDKVDFIHNDDLQTIAKELREQSLK